MDLKFKIIGFKEIRIKEDKSAYCPLDIDAFLKGDIIYDKKHKISNTFSAYDAVLADADLLLINDNGLTLDDFNCTDNNISHDTAHFNGIIQAGFVCVTLDGAIFKNVYLTHLNKLDILTHYRVRANFVIKDKIKDNIYNVML